MRGKPVTQATISGEIISRYNSAAEAARETGSQVSAIQNCCLGKLSQTNGYIWVHSINESDIPTISKSILNPDIPIEWGTNWRDVKGYEGIYKVSEKGVVISLPRVVNGINNNVRFQKLYKMKIHQDKNGYWIVNLSKDYTNDLKLLHRVIAEAFIPNPNNLPHINHKDENPSNYAIDNLEWCNHLYNMNYGTRNERVAAKNTNGKLSKPVLQLDMQGNIIKEWISIAEAERNVFRQSGISNCCAGRIKTHKGFIWKFKETS